MSNQHTEEEEKFLSWFKDNAKSMLVGLVVGIVLIFSYKYYSNYENEVSLNLSYEYQQAIGKYKDGNKEYLMNKANEFSEKYPSHIYTNLINLYSAKILVDMREIDKAFDKLNFIILNTSSDHIKNIAQIRKVRLMISENQLDDALSLINKIDSKRKNYILVELLGDVYYKKGKIQLAKDTYNHVLKFGLTPNKLKTIENKLNTIQ